MATPPSLPPVTPKPNQLQLTTQAEDAVKKINLDLVRDIRRLATIHAKNDESSVIDAKHVLLARGQLTNKHRSWKRWISQLSTLVGGTLFGILATVFFDPSTNHGITLVGGITLGMVTVVLIVVGIQTNG